MRNKIFIYILFICLIAITGCSNNKIDSMDTQNIHEIENSKEEDTVDLNIKIIIDNYTYQIKLENNKTSKELIKLLPLEINMTELNGNEKYYYLDNKLPTNSYNPKKINKGDIMLYGDDCLVLFYETFNTNYSYTKIGHIDNLHDLGSNDITIKLEK